MSEKPAVALVHGAFAESAGWNLVIGLLRAHGLEVVAVANPLRSLTGDATYVRDVVDAIGRTVVLVGHGYGGMVITEAAAGSDSVVALAYVAAFAPRHGESARLLSERSSPRGAHAALVASARATGANEVVVDHDRFRHWLATDLSEGQARSLASTQRPITESALTDRLLAEVPAWMHLPSWFVFGGADRAIPVETHRFMARRAGSRGTRELAGASHTVFVSRPEPVARAIVEAVRSLSSGPTRRPRIRPAPAQGPTSPA